MSVEIENSSQDDAQMLYQLHLAVASQSKFMLYTPAILQNNRDDYILHLQKTIAASNNINLHVKQNGELQAYACGWQLPNLKSQKKMTIVIAVRAEYYRQGIASALLSELEKQALAKGIRRLELSVFEANEPAHKLYLKLGYQQDGFKLDSFYMDEQYHNEIQLYKLLG
ncbi:GNAT family N-acetyltransferase [Catenovulum sp. 2E275]|uniref:GNAT family N-acetyltransferase n=1 Tax=Catenovulum sp. 2E275 TaxID=2980497 RepID=UPI0021D281C3|nr:GNAT family N-acetyltransferase [Catenovulum sp. 2E275]MCU4676917.1 GNAT family N-acetyltransferase [Catenovulum sp. 2E275]